MMPKVCYQDIRFSESSLTTIDSANTIIEEYQAQGYVLTLRQLYYQFVARGWLANRQSEYKRLGSIVNDGRLAGLIDWNAIEDRTRSLRELGHWAGPEEIVQVAAASFRISRWATQPVAVEVWVEKDALLGVLEGVCNRFDVPYFACRGYVSQSEQWRAARRIQQRWRERKQATVVLHLGDHDPSGIDMTRDLADRFRLLGARRVDVQRIALNMDQIEELSPPPNPAKLTDSRCRGYIEQYGNESWELDALEPSYLDELVSRFIGRNIRDPEAWTAAQRQEDESRTLLRSVADRWSEVAALVAPDMEVE
jgi:hypothetical protein